MSTEIAPTLSFEEKLKQKIKDGIGELITDDDLSKLVHRSLEEVFFTPRKNPKKTYYGNNNEPDTIAPLLHDIVKEVLQPMVTEVIKEYVSSHHEEVIKVVETVVTAGVGNAVVTAMNMQFQSQLFNFQTNIQNQLAQK